MLRISVNGGGCSGFQYGFDVDRARQADDVVVERDGAAVLVDEVSLQYMDGSVIDFVRRPDRPVLQDREPAGHRLLRLRDVVLALEPETRALAGSPPASGAEAGSASLRLMRTARASSCIGPRSAARGASPWAHSPSVDLLARRPVGRSGACVSNRAHAELTRRSPAGAVTVGAVSGSRLWGAALAAQSAVRDPSRTSPSRVRLGHLPAAAHRVRRREPLACTTSTPAARPGRRSRWPAASRPALGRAASRSRSCRSSRRSGRSSRQRPTATWSRAASGRAGSPSSRATERAASDE